MRPYVQLRNRRTHWINGERTFCGRALIDLPVERQTTAVDDYLPGDPCLRCVELLALGLAEGLDDARIVLPPSNGLLFRTGPFHNSARSTRLGPTSGGAGQTLWGDE